MTTPTLDAAREAVAAAARRVAAEKLVVGYMDGAVQAGKRAASEALARL